MIWVILILLALAVFVADWAYSNFCAVRTDYVLESERIPESFDNFRILYISDIHNADIPNRIKEQILETAPNVIFLGGDCLQKDTNEMSKPLPFIRALTELAPVYYTMGNHEQALKDACPTAFRHFVNELEQLGVTVLDNEEAWLTKGGHAISLFGLSLPYLYYYYPNLRNEDDLFFDHANIRDMVQGDAERYRILLAHTPDYFELYQKWGVDLVLSGHVHGGMIRIPVLGGLLSPKRQFFPKYDGGAYHEGRTHMFVSRGLVFGGTRWRFNNPSEYITVTLKQIEK